MTTLLPGTGPRVGKLKVVVLLLIALVLGGAGSYFAFGRKPAPPPAAGAEAQAAADGEGAAEGEEGEEGDSGEEGEGAEPLEYVALGAFLVNVMSEGNLRYLRVEVTVGAQEKPAEGKGKKKKAGGHGEGKAPAPSLSPADDARARDAVVRVLSAQTYDHLRSAGPSAELKQAVTEALTEAVHDVKVKSVMFTSFVMQ